MSSRWGGTIVLDRAPDAVWKFLTSETNDVNWRAPWLRSVRRQTDGPMAVGTRYESIYRFFGREEAVVTELIAVEAPRKLAWRQVGMGSLAINDGSYELMAVDGGTRFTVAGVIESRGLARLLDAPFAAYLRRASKQQLAQLAAAMRAAGPG